jgi:glycosyltransferase involved in cell wall biosynthesis
MLAGVLSAGDRTIAEQHDFVTMPGYVTHASAVSLMRTADLLFLPMHELEEGRATIVPGKTYEYLAADVPILAAVPDGDVRDVLETGGRTTFCRPRDVDALALAVERAVDSKTGGGVPAPTPSTAIERYSYPRLADELSGLFDSVLERR